MRVWIDQDLCTGDGLCTDYAPEVFMMLEDGIAYVVHDKIPCNNPGGSQQTAEVPATQVAAVCTAAEACPGECIFIEN